MLWLNYSKYRTRRKKRHTCFSARDSSFDEERPAPSAPTCCPLFSVQEDMRLHAAAE